MKTPLLAAFIVIAAGAAGVAEPRPAAILCDKAKSAGRGYFECLEAALRETDQALTEANRKAKAAVDLRSELAPTQRMRWKHVLDEAQTLFVRFRNFECQNVAPYEGGTRIGAFEERLACLIDKNAARIQDLGRRYEKQ
jgi:uncharacterized protein YecT (DUF1311 family)